MAESLGSLLQAHVKVKLKGCLKRSRESSGGGAGRGRGIIKKVNFNLLEEKLEFEKFSSNLDWNTLPEKRRLNRRSSIVALQREQSSRAVEQMRGLEGSKRALDVPVRTTRSCTMAAAVVLSSVAEKKSRKRVGGVPWTKEFPLVENLDTENQVDAQIVEKETSVEGTLIRSLRNRVVVVGGVKESEVHRNPRGTLTTDAKKTGDVVLAPFPNRVQEKTERRSSGEGPVVKRLRHRQIVIRRDEPSQGQLRSRRARKGKIAGINEDHQVVAQTEEAAFVGKDVITGKRNLRALGAVFNGKALGFEINQEASMNEDPPPRRSKRNLKKSKSPGLEHQNTAIEISKSVALTKRNKEFGEAPHMLKPSRRLTRNASKRTETEIEILLSASGESVDEQEPVVRKKTVKQVRNLAAETEDATIAAPDSTSHTTATERLDKFPESGRPMTRST